MCFELYYIYLIKLNKNIKKIKKLNRKNYYIIKFKLWNVELFGLFLHLWY